MSVSKSSKVPGAAPKSVAPPPHKRAGLPTCYHTLSQHGQVRHFCKINRGPVERALPVYGKSHDEARAAHAQKLLDYALGEDDPSRRGRVEGKLTVGSLALEWLSRDVAVHREGSTWDGYRKQINRFILRYSRLADALPRNLTVLDVEHWLDWIRKQGVGPASEQLALRKLKSTLDYGIRHTDRTHLKRNVAREVKARSYTPKEIAAPDPAALQDLFGEMDGHAAEAIAQTQVLLGLRTEEVLGLQWGDLGEQWVTVSRRVVYSATPENPRKHAHLEAGVKGGKASRPVPLNAAVRRVLAEQRAELIARYTSGRFSKRWRGPSPSDPSGWVFPDARGEMPSPNSYRDWYTRTRKRAGVSSTPHKLRHDYASTLRQRGVGLDQIQRLLGHADIKTTNRHYIHIVPEMHFAAAEVMGDFFDGLMTPPAAQEESA